MNGKVNSKLSPSGYMLHGKTGDGWNDGSSQSGGDQEELPGYLPERVGELKLLHIPDMEQKEP